MLRELIALFLAVLVCVPTAMAGELPDAPSQTKKMEDLKKNADALQLSQETAAVTLNGGSKVKGQITQVTDEGFTVTSKEGQQQYSFADVQTVKKSGLSTTTKVLIGIGIARGGVFALGCAMACGHAD